MAITSAVQDEYGNGKGKGHTSNGNGRGLGHDKHRLDAMSDGVYEIDIGGISAVNHGSVDVVSAQTLLDDGSFLNTEVRAGSITIDAVGGLTALHLVTDSNNGRLRVNDQFSAAQQTTLGDLDNLSFDYYIDASTRTDVIPVIRLAVDGDGDLSTTADRGELVFEYAYQGLGPTTFDQWQHADLISDDWNVWQRSLGANRDFAPNIQPLSEWSDAGGFTPTGGIHFDEHSLVLGWSIALGSGNGTTNAYIDNLNVGGVTYDFVV